MCLSPHVLLDATQEVRYEGCSDLTVNAGKLRVGFEAPVFSSIACARLWCIQVMAMRMLRRTCWRFVTSSPNSGLGVRVLECSVSVSRRPVFSRAWRKIASHHLRECRGCTRAAAGRLKDGHWGSPMPSFKISSLRPVA